MGAKPLHAMDAIAATDVDPAARILTAAPASGRKQKAKAPNKEMTPLESVIGTKKCGDHHLH
jgi:hypothetical protein